MTKTELELFKKMSEKEKETYLMNKIIDSMKMNKRRKENQDGL